MTTRVSELTLGGRAFRLHRPAEDLDALVDRLVDVPGEPVMPYWAHLWPACVALAERLLAEPLAGLRALELGCGLGLAGLAAAAAGAEVTLSDNRPEALAMVRRSAEASGLAVTTRELDWNHPPADLGRWPLILAADVLYERAFAEPVLALIDTHLSDDGVALVADPCRGTAEDALPLARDRFRVTTVIAPITVDGDTTRVAIHELTR